MKKSNMLIAVFAVLAAASVAKAEEIKMDFDGANKGFQAQSMHDIFAAAHSIVPAGALKTDAAASKRIMGGGDDPCCDDPNILCYAPCEPGDSRTLAPNDFRSLARYYAAQGKIRRAIARYYGESGKSVPAELVGKDVRVLAEGGNVYAVLNGRVSRIYAPELAGRITGLMSGGQQKEIATIIAGAGVIIGCMSSDECWETVGDTVSDATQWWVENVQDHSGDPLLNSPD